MSAITAAVIGGVAMVGAAGISAYGANRAAGTVADAAGSANALQQQNRNMSYTASEPNRMLGYQAGADLSSLYGYATPGYTSLNSLLSGQTGGAFSAGGGAGSYGALINPATGTVDIAGNYGTQEGVLTEYLRTGVWNGGNNKKYTKILSAIDQLRASGWTYDPNAKNGTGAGSSGNGLGATPGGSAGNMSRFFTSPDYNFRLSEGQSAIDRGAAARGGALSGNAIRAGVGYASNLASGEYGNYVNRLMQMAGMGTAATNNVINAGNTATNAMNDNTLAAGDARASGVLGTTGAAVGVLNGLGSLYGRYSGGGYNYGGNSGGYSDSLGGYWNNGVNAYNGLDPSLIGIK
jgi:hypothetical protein